VRNLRQEVVKEVTHQPVFPAVNADNLPDMLIKVMYGQVAVQDLLAEEIGMQISCLFYDIETRKDSGRCIHPA
jgi:hypothetical protein